MVVSTGGELDKAEYRKFKMKEQGKNDDTANLEELLRRRFGHPEWRMPDLVILDGGAGQTNRALKVMGELSIAVPVISVVKNEHHRPERILGDSAIIKDHHHDILLTNAEAHRFAITYHKYLRTRHIPKAK